MARSSKVPYPPSPKDVPEDLTLPSPGHVFQMVVVLLGLLLFLLLYLGLVGGSCWAVYKCLTSLGPRSQFGILNLFAAAIFALLALFLVKGLFNRDRPDKTLHVEINEDEQPTLFAFLRKLCDEVGAPEPDQVFVSPEVNAALMQDMSLANLIVPPRKKLLIGLGLINMLNMSEFKAVMAHEFGHFSQKSARMMVYVYNANRVILNIVLGRDWLDGLVERAKGLRTNNQATAVIWATAWAFAGVIWVIRKTLLGLFYAINFAYRSLSRKMEYNADLVAVSVTGSDPIVHGLLRCELAYTALNQALNDLDNAADHKMYTTDIFYHQTRAVDLVRKERKDPHFGEPPPLPTPTAGKKVQVFQPEEDDENSTPPMWRSHPSNFDREENAKAVFIPTYLDERSPWILFDDRADVTERVAYKYYRLRYGVPKDIELTDAKKVQQFIDDERAEMTYDPKYHGAYDGRLIDPGSVEEMLQMLEEEPWEDDRLERVHGRLYAEIGKKVERHQETQKEYSTLLRQCHFKPTGRTKRILDDLDAELKQNWEWFSSFDRRVFLVHAQMAQRLPDQKLFKEILSRYKFHLPLQELNRKAHHHQERVDTFFNLLINTKPEEMPQDLFAEAMHVFRQARKALKEILRDARDLEIPALANFTGDEALDEFLLDEELVRELPENSVTGKWIGTLQNQLGQVLKKSARLYYKSMGNILACQARISTAWLEVRHPEKKIAGDDAKPLASSGKKKGDAAPEAEVIEAEFVEDEPRPAKKKK